VIGKSRNQNNTTTQETHITEREREGKKAMRVGRINQQPVPKASPAPPPAAAAWYCFFDRIEEALKQRESNELSFNHDVSMSTSESMRERESQSSVVTPHTRCVRHEVTKQMTSHTGGHAAHANNTCSSLVSSRHHHRITTHRTPMRLQIHRLVVHLCDISISQSFAQPHTPRHPSLVYSVIPS